MLKKIALAGALALASTTAQAEVTLWKKVGGWDVSFYPGLPGCLASAEYNRGTTFFIGFIRSDRDLLLNVTLMDESWGSIEAGKEYEVKFYFGDESPWTLNMRGERYGQFPGLDFTISAAASQADLFVEEFQRELYMEIFYAGVSLGKYTLKGTRAAFQETIRCQRSFNDAVTSVGDPFSAGSSDPFAR
jgi:hypothetical protein